jgi:hypothetical protein
LEALQSGGQRQVINSRRRILVQDLADGIKLDEISAQRPSQEGFAGKAKQHGNSAQNHADGQRHPRHGMRFAPSRHRPEIVPPLHG